MVYKWCIVPQCTNTSIKSPHKLFVSVPTNPKRRKMWLQLAHRDPKSILSHTNVFMCEDHFDLPNDMENYMQYHVMGSVKQVRMKPDCVPRPFECPPDRRKRTSTVTRTCIKKKRRVNAIQECKTEIEDALSMTEHEVDETHSVTEHKASTTESSDFQELGRSFGPLQSLEAHGQTNAERTCDVSAVKREPGQLPQFCHGCFSVNRALAPLDDLLDLYCSLLENGESIISVLLCWECRARLRRVEEFKANVAAVQTFLGLNQSDQRVSLPPPLSRLGKGSSASEAVESEVKPAEPILMGPADEVKHEAPPSPECPFSPEIEVKQETEDGDTQNDEQTWPTDDLSCRDIPRVSTPAPERKIVPKRKNLKYVRINNTKLCLKKFYRKVPINATELSMLLQQDRKDELFLRYPYRCDYCSRGFMRESAFQTHNLNRHTQSSCYQCDICSARIATKQRLSFHMKTHYFARECTACEYRCASRAGLRRHVLARHHQTVQCRACGAGFHDPRSFHQHYRDLHQHFECDHCGKRRRSRAALERHLARHGPFACAACPGLRLGSRTALSQHAARRHATRGAPERAYCVECDKQFTTVAYYRTHLAQTKVHIDSDRSRPACPECGKTFARRSYMRSHYNFVHLKQTRYACAQCDKSFVESSQYHFHMRRHQPGFAPPRDKLCTVCGRGFSTNSHLANHMRTHTGERPFACTLCAARFGSQVALRAHVNFIHLKRKRKQTRRASGAPQTA